MKLVNSTPSAFGRKAAIAPESRASFRQTAPEMFAVDLPAVVH